MQALFKGEITPGTFYFKCTKTLIVAYMWPVLLTWMNAAVQLLLPLPEIAQIVIHAFIISVVYFPILVHFSLESPLRLEHIFYNVYLKQFFSFLTSTGNFDICIVFTLTYFSCTNTWPLATFFSCSLKIFYTFKTDVGISADHLKKCD